MRGGKLLAEKSPQSLLQEHSTVLLEDIVLKLSQKDAIESDSSEQNITSSNEHPFHLKNVKANSRGVDSFEKIHHVPYPLDESGWSSVGTLASDLKKEPTNNFMDSLTRLKALIFKNYHVLTRNMLFILFILLLPAIQMVFLCLAIGNDPKPLRMGVMNHEMNFSNCLQLTNYEVEGCDVENLSCKYLAKLPSDIHLIPYNTEDEARKGIEEGHVWGFMSFPEGYSDYVYTRSSSGNVVDNETLERSNILLEMDLSNKQIAATLKRILHEGFKDFVQELLSQCGFHPEAANIPIKLNKAIYGSDDTDFRDYSAPSLILGILLFFPLCSSSVSYLWDKKQGTLERSLVAGVQVWEVMLSFCVTEGAILMIQIGLVTFLMVPVFGIQIQGSLILFLGICILMGFTGISLGFLLASICKEEVEVILLSLAAFFPNFILTGMIWPVQGMPEFLQYFSYILPCTLASEAIRSIVSRGWGLFHIHVWPGFVTLLSWITFCWIANITIHRVTKAKQ